MYGTMGYFNYVKEATGLEPFEFLNKFRESSETAQANGTITILSKDAAIIVYAGLNSYLDSLDQPNIPLDKVIKWCNAIGADELGAINKIAFDALSSEEPGEAKA